LQDFSTLSFHISHEDVDRWQEGIRKADPDIAATLDRLLEAEEKKARITLSKGRLRERWRDLWRRWKETIAEVGDEDGRYAVHEHHWEETYFDEVSLSYDLETIAGEMLPLIDDVYALDNEPDLFRDALEKIAAAIAAYPEWMGVEYEEGCTLGKNTTRCVLKWSRLAAGEGPEAGIALLEMVQRMMATDKKVYLDGNACVSFFLNCRPPAAGRSTPAWLRTRKRMNYKWLIRYGVASAIYMKKDSIPRNIWKLAGGSWRKTGNMVRR